MWQESKGKRGHWRHEGLLALALTFVILFFVSLQLNGRSGTRRRATISVSRQPQTRDEASDGLSRSCHALPCRALLSFRSVSQSGCRDLVQVLVSYSYFEKDEGQRENFEYFILEGLGLNGVRTRMPAATDFSIVVNGDECSPCTALSPYLNALDISLEGVSAAWGSPRITVLHRVENFGMDIAAHNVSERRPLPTITESCTVFCQIMLLL